MVESVGYDGLTLRAYQLTGSEAQAVVPAQCMKEKEEAHMTRITLAALMALVVLGWSSTATLAGTASDTMEVTATVVTVCDFSASDVAFGQYTGQALTGTSYWVGTCSTSGTPINYYTLSSGLHYANSSRNMERVGESDLLAYDYTTVSLGYVTDGAGSVSSQVDFEVPAGQIVPAGDYADTLTAGMNF